MDNPLLLRKISLFQDTTPEQLEAINDLLTPAQYQAGEVIFREGECGTTLFLLTEGCVEVIKNIDTPKAVTLATMNAMDYFGEMAIIDGEPRSATVRAKENCLVQIMDGEKFKGLMHDIPAICMVVMRVLNARIRRLEHQSFPPC